MASAREAVPGLRGEPILIHPHISKFLFALDDAGEEGQALVEYALIIAAVALFALGALQLLGTNVSSVLDTVAGGFSGV